MTPTISVTGLSRRYGGQAALDNVSLTVEPGAVTGLLGRNGAGKTTLLRIITGLEFPTTGEVKVFGAAPADNDAVLRRMVFVREEQAYPDFRVSLLLAHEDHPAQHRVIVRRGSTENLDLAGGRELQPGDDAQQGGLARPVAAQQPGHGARLDRE